MEVQFLKSAKLNYRKLYLLLLCDYINAKVTWKQTDLVIDKEYKAAIYKNGAGKFVRILMEEDIIEETQIETGISGNGGKIEILKGVREGDKVITSIKK